MRVTILTTTFLITSMIAVIADEIIPKKWLSEDQLEQAERPIQQQLDTGRAMVPTAWDLAALKDARLLLVYLRVFEKLPDDASRAKFFTEQTTWLELRRKAVDLCADPNGGSIAILGQAGEHMIYTDKRIKELQKRLKH